MENPILITYRKANGDLSTIEFVPNADGGAKLVKDDIEITNFTIIDEGFAPILDMIEKSKQDIYADTYTPINNTNRGNIYTKSGEEVIPLGTFSSEYVPSIDNILVIFHDVIARGDMVTPEGPIQQPMTYYKHRKLGTIVTVDAR